MLQTENDFEINCGSAVLIVKKKIIKIAIFQKVWVNGLWHGVWLVVTVDAVVTWAVTRPLQTPASGSEWECWA